MAATIDPNARIMTLINVFVVPEDKQQELIDILESATEAVMRHQAGFISASIHKSQDGKRVINYAQWRSKEDFESLRGNAEAQRHMQASAALATFEPILCEVHSSYSAG